jgi:hypothetical protein
MLSDHRDHAVRLDRRALPDLGDLRDPQELLELPDLRVRAALRE